jgi:hypothetical protein
MVTTLNPLSVLTLGTIFSFAILTSWPATAAILTWDFSYQPTQGTLTEGLGPGEAPIITELSGPFSTYTGSFSYDDSLLKEFGSQTLDISSTLTTTFPNFNQPLAQYDAVAKFLNGHLTEIVTNWEPCTDFDACLVGGSFVGQKSGNGFLSLKENYLGGPYLLRDYLGDFRLTQRPDVKIPEPSLIWGLAGLSMAGLFMRRKSDSNLADE